MGAVVTVGEIHRGFAQLRDMCDPRGHDLLEALELAFIGQQAGLDRVDGAMQVLAATDTVDTTLRALQPITVRPLLPEEWGHSRRVPLEAVE